MTIFNKLPNVDRCCCLPLKTGCVIIGIWYLVTGGAVGHHIIYTKDYTSFKFVIYDTEFEWSSKKYTCFMWIDDKKCTQNAFSSRYFQVFILLIDGLLMCASAVLLVGIFLLADLGCTIFLYTYLASRVFDLVVLLNFLTLGMVTSCKASGGTRFCCALTCILCIIVGVYVLIVIKSFRRAIRQWNTQIVLPASACLLPQPQKSHLHSHLHAHH